ncbi:MAG TPA: NAD(P)H-quinone oxidoreductase [Vicinamibacterales bacterium]|nr:NAD(P)H-quinone oxidoreductase [Vicinamibacterales bacterium]
MQAIEISQPGPPDVLRLVERPEPTPGAGEVLIDVAAAGVNRPDLSQRQGQYPPPPGVTDIPGLEVAGRIVALGADGPDGPPASASGRRWREGDEVMALVSGGGYAQRCVAPAVQCLPKPASLDLVHAAALPETAFTVWTNVFERGRLRPGETLLVHGGTSGIGSMAIQIATALGSRVITTCGTEEKCRVALELGAIRAINHRIEDFVAEVAALTDRRGVDVVLDFIGGSYAPRNLDCLAREGRLVQIGLMRGASAELSLQKIMLRRLTITGSTLRIGTSAEKGAIAAALEREAWRHIESGRIRPLVNVVLPLGEAAEAHGRLEAGDVIGKVVLVNRQA